MNQTAQAPPTTSTRSYAGWLVLTGLTALLVLGLFEANYRWGYRAVRNEVDVRLLDIERLASRHFRAVLLSDSPTHNPMREYRLAEDVLDLTTTNGPTILGAKFMVQRLFRRNVTTEEMVLFFRPDYLNRDFANVQRVVYLWFHEPSEVEEFTRAGVIGYDAWDVYFKNRFDALNVTSDLVARSRLPKGPFDPRYQLERGLVADTKPILEDEHVQKVFEVNMRIVRDLARLCREHGARLTLVLEPMLKSDHAKYRGSKLQEELTHMEAEGLFRFVDANLIFTPSDEAFFDGAHPRKNWGKYYLLAIDRGVVRLF